SKDTNVLRTGDVAFSPTGKLVASTGGSQVHLWDPDTGKLIKVLVKLEKTDKPLKALAFSPDGKHLAVGGDDGILRVVEVESGKATFTSPSRNARIEKVAYSPNGKLIGVVDSGTPNVNNGVGQVAVYAPAAGNPMPMSVQSGEYGEALGVGFTPDSAAVFTCGRDAKARLTVGPAPDGTAPMNMSTRVRDYVGHVKAVFALAVTPDGKYLVTGGEDKTVRVWEVSSGKQVRAFHGHLGSVIAVTVREDGRQLASASDDGAIRVWDLSATDDHTALTEATDSLWTVAFSPDGKRVAAAGADRTVRVYDPQTGKLEVALTGHTAPITCVAFFPDSNRLASVGGDRVVKVWDVAAKKAKDLPGHTSAILAVAMSDDGKLVVSGSADRSVRGWDPDGGKQLWAWTGKSAVCGVAVRKGSRSVAVGTADGGLTVLDLSAPGSPKEVAPPQTGHVAGVACVAYSPDGNRLVSVGGDGATQVWSVAENGLPAPLVKFPAQPKPGSSTGFSPLTGVAFSPDGRFVATAGADAVIRVWDLQTKSEVRGLRGHTDWATAVMFSPDGRLLASAGVDRAVRVFELTRPETQTGHVLAVSAIAVSPDGKTIATAGKDQTIKLWDRASGRELTTLIENADIPFALTFLGNDGLVMGTGRTSGDTGRLHFWTTKPGRQTRVIATGEVYAAVGNADGTRVAVWASRPAIGDTGKTNTYEVYDRGGELLFSVSDKGRTVKAVTFTPDLGWVLAGDDAGTIQIWDLAKKDRVGADWPLFANPIADVGLTPDRKYLVAVDVPMPDRTGKKTEPLIKVADVATRETLASARAHAPGVRGLVVSPTGDSFVTIGADREVKAWSLKNLKELKETRTWKFSATVNAAAYTPDGKFVVTANADGTAYVLEMP
ncbi:MAG TPA: hypothetical protein VKE74_29750, partial [Gemmataceae bacterium]|nr:hypothetical protein [Gemmataceae bacterium]